MRSILNWRRIRFLDVTCRHDWLQGRCDTWIQKDDGCTAFSKRREAVIQKIPGHSSEADLMTKLLDGKTIQDIVQNIGYHCTKGRSQYALKTALGGLSRVDSGRQRTKNTRTDVRHEHTVQAAQSQRSSGSWERVEWDMRGTRWKKQAVATAAAADVPEVH